MQMHLHPTRREALTASDTALTRWSLETNPATILAQMTIPPGSLFSYWYTPNAHLHTTGGITGSPDGVLFAHRHLPPQEPTYWNVEPFIDWRQWDDFSLARVGSEPYGGISSPVCSPDGRWLVVENIEKLEWLCLLNWQTGEMLSKHAIRGSCMTSLAFDPTSTYVAGVLCSYDGDAILQLWRLGPAEQVVPRPPEEYWPTHETIPQDEVFGSTALTLLYEEWDRRGFEWPNEYLAHAPGYVAFSPDSHMLLFSLHSTIGVGGFALAAFEVPSCELLWSTRHEAQSAGQPIFSPGSSTVLVPMQDGSILAYNAEDGALIQRLATSLNEPVQALAFDHDGKTLWLATEEKLVQFQSQG